MTSKERVLTTIKLQEPDKVPLGEWGVDHDIVEKIIGRSTFYRAKAASQKALWQGRREEVVESWKRDLVELTEKLNYDLVLVFPVPPKNQPPVKVKKIDATTWQDEDGNIFKYSAGNDAFIRVKKESSLSPPFRFSDFEEYFRKLVTNFGFRMEGEGERGYRFILEDPSVLELIEYVVSRLGEEKFIVARAEEFSDGFWEFGWIDFSEEVYFYEAVVWQPDFLKKCFDLMTEFSFS
jgi:hypothetical protein